MTRGDVHVRIVGARATGAAAIGGRMHVYGASAAERGSSLLEAVAALATASLILATAATQGLQSATAVTEARSASNALTLARNVLDRALAAPCAPAGYATAICVEPYRCAVGTQALGQRIRPSGTVSIMRLTAEVFVHGEGTEDRRLARLVSVGAQPPVCS